MRKNPTSTRAFGVPVTPSTSPANSLFWSILRVSLNGSIFYRDSVRSDHGKGNGINNLHKLSFKKIEAYIPHVQIHQPSDFVTDSTFPPFLSPVALSFFSEYHHTEPSFLGHSRWAEPVEPNQSGPNPKAGRTMLKALGLQRAAPIPHHTLSAMEVVS